LDTHCLLCFECATYDKVDEVLVVLLRCQAFFDDYLAMLEESLVKARHEAGESDPVDAVHEWEILKVLKLVNVLPFLDLLYVLFELSSMQGCKDAVIFAGDAGFSLARARVEKR
jgi:hypothetical protein